MGERRRRADGGEGRLREIDVIHVELRHRKHRRQMLLRLLVLRRTDDAVTVVVVGTGGDNDDTAAAATRSASDGSEVGILLQRKRFAGELERKRFPVGEALKEKKEKG